ncbi:MAG: mismatch-specific DNA-glycosylase [Deltaproteobacteria bacterium]
MHHKLPDYLRPGLDVVFVGFNPGERSARIGHYYAGRGNQFWPLLFESGLLPRRLGPEDDHQILGFGIGMTDVVKRWSRSANELRAADFKSGIRRLRRVLKGASPRVVAFNGKTAYEKLNGQSTKLGWQKEMLEGARVFVLPSTSGRNGSLTRAGKLAFFRSLARWVKRNA